MKFWDSIKVFFVVRVKDNLLYERIQERELPDNTHPEVLIDEIVKLTGNETSEQYPKTHTENCRLQCPTRLHGGTADQQYETFSRNHCRLVQSTMGY